MRMVLAGFLSFVVFMPLGVADDLTDALLDTNPRSRLESGTGAAYGSIYAPEDQSSSPSETLNPNEVPSLSYGFGDAYKHLRSPLYQSEEEASSTHLEDPLSTFVPPLEPGKPYQRDGVWYGDEPHR